MKCATVVVILCEIDRPPLSQVWGYLTSLSTRMVYPRLIDECNIAIVHDARYDKTFEYVTKKVDLSILRNVSAGSCWLEDAPTDSECASMYEPSDDTEEEEEEEELESGSKRYCYNEV